MQFKATKQVMVSTASLICSLAVLVLLGAEMHHPAGQDIKTLSYRISGNHLRSVMGYASAAGDTLKLSALEDGIAVISSGHVRFLASKFPYLTLHQTGLDTRLSVALFWRLRGQEDTVHTEQISHFDDGLLTLHLANNSQWIGEVVEIGLSVQGDLQQPLVIEAISLDPWTTINWVYSIWDQWWAYGGWKGTSINFISGGMYDKVQNIPAPELPMLPVVAIWLGLSISLYVLAIQLLTLKIEWYSVFTMFVLAWVLLDSRWLYELWMRTQVTQNSYSGKNQQQKWQHENDRQWYRMVEEVKQYIPEQSARIFLVLKTRRPLDDYYRYRVRYHLLPHNVFPYRQTLPEQQQMKRGDYILDLGENNDVHYDSEELQLVNTQLKSDALHHIQLNYKSRLGRLYQYQGG